MTEGGAEEMVEPPEIAVGDYGPGAIGRIVEMHARYYAEHWGFGAYFEAKVAGDLAAFVLRPPGEDSRLWCARIGERIVGSIAIDGDAIDGDAIDGEGADETGAHLRWFIIEPGLQGRGLGRRLLTTAIDFCRQRGFARVYLNTFAGLDAARRLYEDAGFDLAAEAEGEVWGTRVLEQRFTLDLAAR